MAAIISIKASHHFLMQASSQTLMQASFPEWCQLHMIWCKASQNDASVVRINQLFYEFSESNKLLHATHWISSKFFPVRLQETDWSTDPWTTQLIKTCLQNLWESLLTSSCLGHTLERIFFDLDIVHLITSFGSAWITWQEASEPWAWLHEIAKTMSKTQVQIEFGTITCLQTNLSFVLAK